MHCFDVLLANSTARASIVLPSNSSKYTFDNITIANAPTSEFYYYIQDHLGNNRVVMNESGAVEQITNYYPFGGVFSTMQSSYNTNSDHQPYKYNGNGKELDRRHGLDWYDYGARNYDAIVPMFTSIDPCCEKFYNTSPYIYCYNNPVNAVDPDGRIGHIIAGAVIGGSIEYLSQVTSNCIAASEDNTLGVDCFTNVNWTDIGVATIAGGVSGGASALGSYASRKGASKLGAKIVEASTEFVGELIGAKGDVKKAAKSYSLNKVGELKEFKPMQVMSNRKTLKKAIAEAEKKGKKLTTEAKNSIRYKNNINRKRQTEYNRRQIRYGYYRDFCWGCFCEIALK